ncbi:MAG: DUF692 domain-containing protein [Methyloceanibacter sp.]
MTTFFPHQVQNRAGVGLRLSHIAEVVATRPPAAWLEIHPENFLANPHATELLVDLSRIYPISVHTVGVSIGSAAGIDPAHMKRVRALIDLIDPILVSGHMAWSTHEGDYLNDLLPLPYDANSLDLLAKHIDIVQNGLGRPYLIENPSSYVAFNTSTMSEVEFLNELVARTGCQILCDVSNVYVSAYNMGFDPIEYINGLPADAIGELHLGGFSPEDDEATPGHQILIDTHSTAIAAPALDLHAHAIRRFGPKPTLIEWDNDIPPFATLLNEAARADSVAAAAFGAEARRVAAR